MGSIRFDPVWRRIKADTLTTKLEGQFRVRLDRLDGLNNWGSLGWLYDHATATKQAHHFGLEWNAVKFVEADADRSKHEASLRPAAHLAHWGHVPLSYAGEEAILRAAHVEANIAGVIDTLLGEVISFGALRCDVDGHDCAVAVRSGDRPFELYRWISAWLVKENWRKLWKTVNGCFNTTPDEEATKIALIETLVCRESRGFRVLRRCNQADYVPRDLLQAGTAWLTFDIEALWEGNPLGTDAAKEWSLIDAAQKYLDERFFHSPDGLLVHSLVSRAIAGGLLAEGLTKKGLVALTTATDDHYSTKLKQYHRDRLAELRSQIPRIGESWQYVGAFTNVSLDEGSRLAMEDQLSGVTGRSRISYPFNTGVSVIVEPGATSLPFDFAGPGRRFGTVHVHQNVPPKSPCALRPMLNVVARIADRLPPGPQLGNNVMTWLVGKPVEQRTAPVQRVCDEIASKNADRLQSIVSALLSSKSAEDVLKHSLMSSVLIAMADPGYPVEQRSRLSALLLWLPWVCLRYSPGRAVLQLLREEALVRAASGDSPSRGYALELAVAADQLLDVGGPKYRALSIRSTSLGKDGQPSQEWDVLRLDLVAAQGWSLTAVECAVGRTRAKDQESRERLDCLQERLRGRYSDLTAYRTLLATIKDAELHYEDAGRGLTKV